MIIVSGANGQLGRLVVEQLLKRVPAGDLAVSVRDANKASALADRGVRVRQASYDDRGSLRYAYQDAEIVLVISSNTPNTDALVHHRNAVEAAMEAGAQRVVYTSHMGSNRASHFPPMVDHARTEAMLAESGMPFTSLRNGYYAASGIMLMGQALETGDLVAPADGKVSWTAHADLAEAAAIALSDPGKLDGITSPLTGSEALDLGEIAAIASDLTGATIRRVVADDEDFIEAIKQRGVPEWRLNLMRGVFLSMREGEFARTDPTLQTLLGRKPKTMRDTLAAHLAR